MRCGRLRLITFRSPNLDAKEEGEAAEGEGEAAVAGGVVAEGTTTKIEEVVVVAEEVWFTL